MNSRPTPPVFFLGRVAVALFLLLLSTTRIVAANGDAPAGALSVAEADHLIRSALAQPAASRDPSRNTEAARRAAQERAAKLWELIPTAADRSGQLIESPASRERDAELDRHIATLDAFIVDPLHWETDTLKLLPWMQFFGSKLSYIMLASANAHLARGRPESALLRLEWAVHWCFSQITVFGDYPEMSDLLKNTPAGRKVLERARRRYLDRFDSETVRAAQHDFKAAIELTLDYHSPEAFLTAARLAQNLRPNAAGNDALLLSCMVLDRLMHVRNDPGYRLLWGDDWPEKFDAQLRDDTMLRRLRRTRWMQSHLDRKEGEEIGLCSKMTTDLFAARFIGRSRYQIIPPGMNLADMYWKAANSDIGLRWKNPRPDDAAAGASDAQKFLATQALALVLPEYFLNAPLSNPILERALAQDPAAQSKANNMVAALAANIEARDDTPDEAFSKVAATTLLCVTDRGVTDFDITYNFDSLASKTPVLLPFACYQLALLGEKSGNARWTRLAVDYLFSPAD